MLEKVDIQETISRYHEGASMFDWDAIIATFLPDGVWEVPSLHIRAEGHAGIRETMEPLVAPIEYLVQINAPAIIDVHGDTASARSLIRECAKLRDNGEYLDVVGQFSDRLQRTSDGWKFAHRTFSVLGSHATGRNR